MLRQTKLKKFKGFTLAELLVALLILGQIATFTIPKVISSQQKGQYKAIAKETAAMISAAYRQYQLENTVSSSTKAADLTPYMNYVKVTTSGVVDDAQTLTTYACASVCPCLHLHNGAVLLVGWPSFGGNNTTNAISFLLDPDGKETVVGSTNSPGKGIWFWVYPNGRLTSYGTLTSGTSDSTGVSYIPRPEWDPPWFSWD